MRVALYSAIYGGYDFPKVVPVSLGVPALMYTDNRETALLAEKHGWEVKFMVMNALWSSMMAHKWWKLHPELATPDADVSLWVDGSMTVVDDYVDKCVTALGDDDWVMVPHPSRNCIYDEAAYSATLTWRYDAKAITTQAAYYESIGHPKWWGLFATGANVRRNTDTVRELGRHWWWENVERSHQDQISLPVLMRLMQDRLKWNANMPWHEWWHLAEHDNPRW